MNSTALLSDIVLTTGRHTITLRTSKITDTDRTFGLEIDGIPKGELSILRYYLLSMGVDPNYLILWGGTRSWFISLAEGTLTFVNQADEVHTVYPVEDRWFFVCETSVFLFDPSKAIIEATYLHNEVLVKSWWVEDVLFVEDFQGQQLIWPPLTVTSNFEPQYH